VHTVTTLAAIIIRAKRTNEILDILAYEQTGKTVLRPMFWLKITGDYI